MSKYIGDRSGFNTDPRCHCDWCRWDSFFSRDASQLDHVLDLKIMSLADKLVDELKTMRPRYKTIRKYLWAAARAARIRS
jgi:hypothetical protein